MREYVEPVMMIKMISLSDIIVTSIGEATNANGDVGTGLNGNDQGTHDTFWGDDEP